MVINFYTNVYINYLKITQILFRRHLCGKEKTFVWKTKPQKKKEKKIPQNKLMKNWILNLSPNNLWFSRTVLFSASRLLTFSYLSLQLHHGKLLQRWFRQLRWRFSRRRSSFWYQHLLWGRKSPRISWSSHLRSKGISSHSLLLIILYSNYLLNVFFLSNFLSLFGIYKFRVCKEIVLFSQL